MCVRITFVGSSLNPSTFNHKPCILCIEPCHQKKPFSDQLLLLLTKRQSSNSTLVILNVEQHFCCHESARFPILYPKAAIIVCDKKILRQMQTDKKPTALLKRLQSYGLLKARDRLKWLYSGSLVCVICGVLMLAVEFPVGVLH